jgi:hypothetical protein
LEILEKFGISKVSLQDLEKSWFGISKVSLQDLEKS